MKKILVVFGLMFVCITALAHTIEWYVDGSLYQTTTCEAGDSITPPTAPEKYGYHFVEWGAYTQLEYIESTGTQWIDTGFTANGGMVLDAKVLPINDNMTIGSIGPSSIAANTTRNLIRYTSGYYSPEKMNQYGHKYLDAGTSPAVIHMDTTGTKFYCTVNGTQVINTTTGILTDLTTTVKVSYSDYNDEIRAGRYYYVQIKDSNNTIVRNLIPAKRTIDNAIGMYDTVSGQFFTNAGTGEFIAGSEVGGL